MKKNQANKNAQKKENNHQEDNITNELSELGILEIDQLLTDSDFIDFAQTIACLIDDGITFDDLLSSKTILKKALLLLERGNNENLVKNE